MILFIHGTGDDDTKHENWMPWVAKIMEKHGELALVIPGVQSSEKNKIGDRIVEFLTKLARGPSTIRANHRIPCPALARSLNEGGGELLRAANCGHGEEEARILALINGQRNESGAFTSGIKVRVAAAALAVMAYYRRRQVLRPIRIIGHSRGGSVAIGIHNVLSYYGIPCNATLSLDPCHGVDNAVVGAAIGTVVPVLGNLIGYKIGRSQMKSYYHKVWAGNVYNMPVKKGVGATWAGFAVFRPEISVGSGGVATVTNQAKLKKIKHGHMGKLCSLAGDDAAKDRARVNLKNRFEGVVARNYDTPARHLREFWRSGLQYGTSDYADRCAIIGRVTTTLLG